MYNALVRKLPGWVPEDNISDAIIGRVFLNTLNLIPERWTVLFRGTALNHTTTDIGKLMCTSKDPLTIFKGPWDPKWMITVYVQVVSSGEYFGIKISKEATVATLKSQIEKRGIIIGSQHVLCHKNFRNQLNNSNKTLKDYMIGDGSQITISVVDKSKFTEQHRGSATIEMEIFVKTVDSTTIPLFVTPSYTVQEIKYMLNSCARIPVDQQRLFYERWQMEDGRALMDYNVVPRSTLNLNMRLRGGGDINGCLYTQDVEAAQVSGRSSGLAEFYWNGYTSGMNLYGICTNEYCASRNNGKVRKVVFKACYGQILLTPERMKFECPACKDSMCSISQFLVANGRALFRFKKIGVGQQVKTVVLESLGSAREYKKFSEQGGNARYDFIEITTVNVPESFYHCVRCDEGIKLKTEEVTLECGHAYHDKCSPIGYDKQCVVCDARPVESIYDLLGVDTRNSNAEAVAILPKRIW